MDRIYKEEPSYWPHGLSIAGHDGGVYLIREASTKDPVGFVGWQERERDGLKTGYYTIGVLPEYRGHKMAKEAVAKIIEAKGAGVDRVRAYIMPHNTPSIGLANALGVPVVKEASVLAKKALDAHTFSDGAKMVNNLGGVNSIKTVLGSALGTGALWDAFYNARQHKNMDQYLHDWDGDRASQFALNSVFGGGIGAGAAAAHSTAGGITGLVAGQSAIPVKDLALALYPGATKLPQALSKYVNSDGGPDGAWYKDPRPWPPSSAAEPLEWERCPCWARVRHLLRAPTSPRSRLSCQSDTPATQRQLLKCLSTSSPCRTTLRMPLPATPAVTSGKMHGIVPGDADPTVTFLPTTRRTRRLMKCPCCQSQPAMKANLCVSA